jgi:hypothetical protein
MRFLSCSSIFKHLKSCQGREGEKIVTSQERRKLSFCLAAWLFGVSFTLLKGIWFDPWGVSIFNLDLLTILTAYLFLSFGRMQAGAFALGQGLLIDIFSSGLNGLFTFLYLIVFLGIYLGSLFFNLQSAKGQIMIVTLVIFFKYIVFLTVLSLFSNSIIFSKSFLSASAISIIGTGLITPIFFIFFNWLMGISGREADTPISEEL